MPTTFIRYVWLVAIAFDFTLTGRTYAADVLVLNVSDVFIGLDALTKKEKLYPVLGVTLNLDTEKNMSDDGLDGKTDRDWLPNTSTLVCISDVDEFSVMFRGEV